MNLNNNNNKMNMKLISDLKKWISENRIDFNLKMKFFSTESLNFKMKLNSKA
jgi:hypothetical protein